MPAISLNVMIKDQTTQTIKIVDETSDFWVEVIHLTTNSQFSSKTNSIDQNLCSTTAILVGTIYYYQSSSNKSTSHDVTGNHVLLLQYISMISTNHSTARDQALIEVLQANPMPVDSNGQPSQKQET
ncbi:10684_t:CDS:2 [Gigaspora margarita]|uniref:10684_t:CDS:1 n=1 Tax=Gigaspora margarita TaxID=4874 RepID=A0ABN7VJ25_GIGMA|nr:10684_t:CDS:2 [Gigaspora margarita]